jgi:hypothetical protein
LVFTQLRPVASNAAALDVLVMFLGDVVVEIACSIGTAVE